MILPAFPRPDLRRHVEDRAGPGPDGLLLAGGKGTLIYRPSDEESRGEVAAGLDATVRKARAAAARKAAERRSGTDLARGE
ncbi:hypothetical protein SUDANB58_03032 [Streptomyces sp. enrichment culture]